MTEEIVSAVNDHQRRYDTAAWIQPVEGLRHLSLIEDHLRSSADRYPHVFAYPEVPVQQYLADLEPIRRMVRDAPVHPCLAEAVVHHLDRLALRGRAVAAGDAEYSRITAELDGTPPPELVLLARGILSTPLPIGNEVGDIGASAAAAAIQGALRNYGLDTEHWYVEVSEAMTARMSVNGPLRRVRVRSDAVFTRSEVARLLAHEVGGHVLRWVNSSRQREPLAGMPLGATVPTEEGLALWQEVRFALTDPHVHRVYAARTIAADIARSEGILAVGRSILPLVGPRKAAEIAMRAKRGLRDPNAPGGATKDWGYLGGLQMITRLAQEQPDSLPLIQSVKWSAAHLDAVRELAGLGLIEVEQLLQPDMALLGIADVLSKK